MKKQISLFLLVFLIFSISSVDAKPKHLRKSHPNIGFGVKAGLNYASQSSTVSTPDVDLSSIIRMNGGAYFNYFFLKSLAIQPELMLSGKGTHWQDPYYNAKDVLTYLEMPILIKFQPVDLLNFHIGPDFSYLVKATQKDLDNNQSADIKDYYKKFDLGLAFGIEATLPFRVYITIRYVLGLKTATTDTQYDTPWKNNFFQISAGYRILGK